MNKFDAFLDCNIEKTLVSKTIETKSASVKFRVLIDDTLDLVGNLYEKSTTNFQVLLNVKPTENITATNQRNLVRRLLQSQFVGDRLVEYSSTDDSIYIQNVRHSNNNNIECDIQYLSNGNRFRHIEIHSQVSVTQNELRQFRNENRIVQTLNDNLDQFEDRIFLSLLNSQEPANFAVKDNMSTDVIFEMIEELESQNIRPQTILLHPMYFRFLNSNNMTNLSITNSMFAGLNVIPNPLLDNKIYVLSNEVGNLITFNDRTISYHPMNDVFTTMFNISERINMVISKKFSSRRIQNGATR